MLAKKKSGQGQAILFDELITLIYPTLQIYEKTFIYYISFEKILTR